MSVATPWPKEAMPPDIIFKFFFDKIEESVQGHYFAAWAPDFRKPKIFKTALPYRKINYFLNQTFLSIVSALLFLKSEIEKSGLGHCCAAWAPDFRKPKIFKTGLSYRKINYFLNQTFLSILSALLFLKREIEKSGLGHCCAAWAPDFRKPKVFKTGLPYRKINYFLNQTFLSIVSALLFLKREIEKSGLGHCCAAWAPDFRKPKIFKTGLPYRKINFF